MIKLFKVRYFIFLLILLFLNTSCSNANSIGEVSILNEKLTISFDLSKSRLICKADIIFSKRPDYVNLYLDKNAKILKVYNGFNEKSYRFSNGIIEIEQIKSEEENILTIEYYIDFQSKQVQKMDDLENPSAHLISYISNESVFIGNEIVWYPQIDSQPDSIELIFMSPMFEFVTDGKKLEHIVDSRNKISKWLVNKPKKNIAVVGGKFVIKETNYKNILVYVYFSEENLKFAQDYLEATKKYLEFYSQLIGPYPYDKFAVVETELPIGISYPTFTVISKDIVKLPFILDTSLPHEILHSWFGNGVFIDYKMGNWAEGLVTYLADYLFKEKKSRKEALEYLRKLIYDYSTIVKESNEYPLKEFVGRYDLPSRVIGYGKSAMFFHYLRNYVGDEVFFKSISEFYKENINKNASWWDIKNSFQKNFDKDLEKIFYEWLTRKGVPDFFIYKAEKKYQDNLWNLKIFIRQNKPYYNLRIPVTVYNRNDKLIFKNNLELKESEISIKFDLIDEPAYIVLDENFSILRRLENIEIPPTINSIKSAKKVIIIRSIEDISDDIIERFIKTMGLKEVKVSNNVDDDNVYDVIVYFGVLSDFENKFLKIYKNRIIFENNIYDGLEDSVFLITKRDDKIEAIFHALSKKGAEKVINKLTHYGPFSYLIFKDGKIEKKGIYEIEKSRVKFNL